MRHGFWLFVLGAALSVISIGSPPKDSGFPLWFHVVVFSVGVLLALAGAVGEAQEHARK